MPPFSLDVEVHNPHFLAAAMSLDRKLELWDQYTVVNAPLPALSAKGHGLLLALAPPPRLALLTPNTTPLPPAMVTVEGRPVKRLS